MKEQYDINILESIRSQNSNQSEERKKIQATLDKTSNNKNLALDREIQIRDTFDDDSSQQAKDKGKEDKMEWRKSSGSSDWNDTDQILKSAKKDDMNGKYHDKSQGKKKNQKSKQKQKELAKYPEILFPSALSQSPKKKQDQKKLKLQEKAKITLSVQNSDDNDLFDYDASMIGERIPIKVHSDKKQQPTQPKFTQKQPIQRKASGKISQKNNEPVPNIFQSVIVPSTKKQEIRTDVFLKVMDNTMYWIHEDKEMKITSETFEALVQQFFKKEIMLPLISDSQFKSGHIALYMQVYTEFLNEFFSTHFKATFATLKSNLQPGSKFTTGTNPLTPKSSPSSLFKNLYDNYVPTFLKGSGYSKPQLLRNYMTKKLEMLTHLLLIRRGKNTHQQLILQQKKKQIQHNIAVLEMLVSFENSQNYCKTNSKEGIDQGIWKQHSKKISQLRKKWVGKIQENKDFSFKI